MTKSVSHANSVDGVAAAVDDDRTVWDRHHSFMEENLPRNYAVSLIHGMLGFTGFRMMYAPTIIPAYLYGLTGSAATVGLGTALLQLGGILSPLISGARIESRNRILPYAITTGGWLRVMVLALAIAAWLLEGTVLLWTTLAIFFLLGYYHGAQRVAFNMLMAKLIPINRRGRLQGVRNFIGGIIAAALAWFAGTYFIEHEWLGNGYATTFLLAFVLTAIGLLALQLGVREPDAPVMRASVPLRERLHQFRELLQHRDFSAFLSVHALSSLAKVSLPFWTLYIGEQMGLDGSLIGWLSLAFISADTMSNILWGPIGDRLGFRIVYAIATMFGLLGMLFLVLGDDWLLYAAFVALGFASCGWQMAAYTLVLEFGAHEDIPMRLGLVGTVESAVSFIGPIAAGFAIAWAGYSPLIVVTVVTLGLALALITFFVKEPRHTRPDPV